MYLSHVAHIALRSTLLTCAFLLSSTFGFSQTSESDPTGSPVTASTPRSSDVQHRETGSVEATVPAMKDKMFLRSATIVGMVEVQLSELALRKSTSDDVKQFASLMVADHATLIESLRASAESQGVRLPNKLPPREQTTYEQLRALSGEDFDRQYIKILADDHHKELREFRSEIANTQDVMLRSVVQDATATLHRHMILADHMARTKGVQGSRPGGVAASATPQ